MYKVNSVVVAVMLCSSSLQAKDDRVSDINIIAGIGVGYTELDFPAKLDSSPTFPSTILTGSLVYQDTYLNLSYAGSISDEDISEEEDIGKATRTDIDLTFGYNLTNEWTVFAGYKDSETDLELSLRDDEGSSRSEFYKKDGFFIGASYSIDLEDSGSLTFSAGYTDLDSDNLFLADIEEEDECDDDCEIDELEEFDDLSGRVSGTADGWSLGISYLVPVNQNMAINVSYKVNDYQEDISVENKVFTADQRLRFFNVGLIYLF